LRWWLGRSSAAASIAVDTTVAAVAGHFAFLNTTTTWLRAWTKVKIIPKEMRVAIWDQSDTCSTSKVTVDALIHHRWERALATNLWHALGTVIRLVVEVAHTARFRKCQILMAATYVVAVLFGRWLRT
jgi:hypothetical protein